jgi:hypothetical protein
MAEQRLRTKVRKMRNRAQFWDTHGEKIRLTLIGTGVVVIVSAIMTLAIG